jgi:heme exporter protein C
VVWWNTLHQGATFTITNAPKMDSSMYWPLLMTFLGIYALVGAYVLHRTGSKILNKNAHTSWVQQQLGLR